MGLSDQERVEKTYWALHWLRYRLVDLHNNTPNYFVHTKEVVSSWVERVDSLSGRLITAQDASVAYWILGPNEDNYRSLFSEINLSEIHRENGTFALPEPKHGSFGWFETLDLPEFVICLTRSPFSEEHKDEARILAEWWRMWEIVDGLLYPVYRYTDKLFPKEIHEDIWMLLGEMANRRYEVALGRRSDDVTELVSIERGILGRYKAFQILLKQREPKLPNYKGKSAAKKEQAYNKWKEATYVAPFPGFKLVQEIGHMSLEEIRKICEDESDRRHRAQWDYQKKENAEAKDKPDGILGPNIS